MGKSNSKNYKESFKRFGDDICELILSYLSISDCFRLMCVNKQIKSLIYNKQTKLLITDSLFDKKFNTLNGFFKTYNVNKKEISIDNNCLDYVLTKCKNITDIIIYTMFSHTYLTDETLDIISNRCSKLKYLELKISFSRISLKNLQNFGIICLKNIDSLSYHNFIYDDFFKNTILLQKLTLYTINLKFIKYNTSLNFLIDRIIQQNKQNVLNKLEYVNYYTIRDKNFLDFVNYFEHRLKFLYVKFHQYEIKIEPNILKGLSNFNNIEFLYCDFDNGKNLYYMSLLKEIGIKCSKLSVLIIDKLDSNFYQSFRYGFNSLKILIIKRKIKISENLSLLKNCLKLNHIQFSRSFVNERDLIDIHTYMPQIKKFEIFNNQNSLRSNSSNVLQHLSLLPNLNTINLGYIFSKFKFSITDIILFINKCINIRKIGLFGYYSKEIIIIENYIKQLNRKITLVLLHKAD